MAEPLDCLIVGGGPAGLTAAIYLARFHLDILVVDDGKGRAESIPCTHNHAGYPDGISGKELVRLMREQAQKYGARIERDYVTRLDKTEQGFCAAWGSGSVEAKTVLLATGVKNRRPPMDEELHDEALARGLIRYCPICDGYEVTDKKVGVMGSDRHGVAEAVFLRSFTRARHARRPAQGIGPDAEDQARSSRRPGSNASTDLPKRWRSAATASSSIRPKGIMPSTACIRRSAPTRIRSWPSRSVLA